MKINDFSIAPTIVTDVTGRITLLNNLAKKELKPCKVGDNIDKFIDKSTFTKLTMRTDIIDAVEVNMNDYEMAIIRVSGEGLSKTIRITLHKIDDSLENLCDDKEMLASLNGISLDYRTESINPRKFGQDLISYINNAPDVSYPHVNLYAEDREFFTRSLQLQALILCSISMMHETSPKRPVDLYIKSKGKDLQVKIIVRVDDNIRLNNVQAIEKLYPWTTVRFALIDDICEKGNISYSATVSEKSLKVIYMIKEDAREKAALLSPPFTMDFIPHLVASLKPRARIVLKRREEAIEE